ncbi:MAG: anaerobic ribonucleoside-triphosphate reductase activating protein [Tyzzerella sp.]|nr:anaerobic ribonucleoside-triphosphate reductase activating protein [Tyzzerella sp.]
MRIQGLQKLTLLDFPERTACTVFTAGCNFRCPFCHNASLVVDIPKEAEISEEEFFAFLQKRKGILDGVCVSGGEPLLQPDIEQFIRKIKDMGFAVKLDTNGSFPNKLIHMVEQGLVDYVAMDIKNSPETYAFTSGTEALDIEAIKKSVSYLKEGHVPFEFRTTVVKRYHSKESFEEIGEWLSGTEKYFLQNFVDSGDLIGKNTRGCSEEEMKEFLQVVQQYIPNAQLRGI